MLTLKTRIISLCCLSFFSLLLLSFCSGQENPKSLEDNPVSNDLRDVFNTSGPESNSQIADFVVEVYEDKKGNLWFGTIAYGVARYDGISLKYFSPNRELGGKSVVSITEDGEGNFWFGTHTGLTRYDGETFTNFTKKDGVIHNRVSEVLVDSKGNIWVGTWGGVSRFDGTTFTDFPLPTPDVEFQDYQSTMDWVTEIKEDRKGNIWIGRDGYGVCKYDPTSGSFTSFTKEDGLPSNNIQAIQEDEKGNIWFGSRVTERDHPDADKRTGEGGLSKYDGNTIIQFLNEPGLHKNDVYAISKDKSGNIWVSTIDHGAYKYDGQSFTNYTQNTYLSDAENSVPFYGIQSILEDKEGNIWFGCSGGLFRLDAMGVINVTRSGPWD